MVAGLIFAFVGGAYAANPSMLGGLSLGGNYTPVTRYYTLNIEGVNISQGTNAVWHAWTYNGTVPGPTLHAEIGDKIIVKVNNHLNLIISFHTHLVDYNFTSDGSQANVIAGMGAGAMIPPGQSYTYYFNATYAGAFLYHDHSSDQYPISYHMAQGLYGIFMVDDPKHPPPKLAHEWTVAMAEMGPQVTGTGYAPYIMDGLGFPGGEPALVNLFDAQGLPGVVSQFNKTLLAFEAHVGDIVRFDVFNPGALGVTHTFHLHDSELIDEYGDVGVPYNDANIPLDPGVTAVALVTLTQPGVFLFHCHVVPHADAGMIGVLVVLPKASSTTTTQSSSANTTSTSSSSVISFTSLTSSVSTSPKTTSISILANSGNNASSKGYSPDVVHVVVGVNNTVMWTNNDDTVHTVTSSTAGLFDSGYLIAGQSWTYTFQTPGTYQYHCSIHPWMTGTVIVTAGA
ncbi:MAG TPA: multicopper oxidase domain-containing protein [Nitrososphaerales archaeon]|nr:multicopper oxidase domain-containing protein [Nitrososphaerales archaeon]